MYVAVCFFFKFIYPYDQPRSDFFGISVWKYVGDRVIIKDLYDLYDFNFKF